MGSDADLGKLLLDLIKRFPQSSAVLLVRALEEKGLETDKRDVNRILYQMLMRGLVQRITDGKGFKPRWTAFDSDVRRHPALEQLYLRAMKSPREKVYLAEIIAEVFEALEYHRAKVLRKMADAIKR